MVVQEGVHELKQGGFLGAEGRTLYGLNEVHKNNQEYETLTRGVGMLGATRDS
jgi:hypothetical protein